MSPSTEFSRGKSRHTPKIPEIDQNLDFTDIPKRFRIAKKKKKIIITADHQPGEQMVSINVNVFGSAHTVCVLRYGESWLDSDEVMQPGETRRQWK